jgi:hypothetical protein
MQPRCLPADEKNDTRILGPAWGDAEFYGNWLLMAAKANELLQQARSHGPEFKADSDHIDA